MKTISPAIKVVALEGVKYFQFIQLNKHNIIFQIIKEAHIIISNEARETTDESQHLHNKSFEETSNRSFMSPYINLVNNKLICDIVNGEK